MDSYEIKQDIKRMHEILRKQKKRVSSSKKEARKLLKELGILHLLVPIKAEKFTNASKFKSTGK